MKPIWSFALLLSLLLPGCKRTEVPATKARDPNPSEVRFNPALLETGQLRVERVSASIEPAVVRTSGKGGFNEDRLSYVSSPLIGRVADIRVRAGEHVDAGQTLVVIDSPELGEAFSELIKARADLVLSEKAFALAKELSAAKAMARKDFQKAEDDYVKAKTDERRTRERLVSLGVPPRELDVPLDALHVRSQFNLTAPIGGTVVERHLTLGQMVGSDPAQRLFVIADLRTLWVTADIYEKDLPRIHVGQEVSVQAAAWPGEEFKGRINYVGDTVDPDTRTVKVRLAVDNHELRLKPEMFVTATVSAEGTTTALSVPLAAIHGEGVGQPYVFVVLGDDRAVPRSVTLGDKFSDRAVILSGLGPEDRVVTEGSILLKAEEARQAEG
jgi:membrane fusion protein, heavy metal efflux system